MILTRWWRRMVAWFRKWLLRWRATSRDLDAPPAHWLADVARLTAAGTEVLPSPSGSGAPPGQPVAPARKQRGNGPAHWRAHASRIGRGLPAVQPLAPGSRDVTEHGHAAPEPRAAPASSPVPARTPRAATRLRPPTAVRHAVQEVHGARISSSRAAGTTGERPARTWRISYPPRAAAAQAASGPDHPRADTARSSMTGGDGAEASAPAAAQRFPGRTHRSQPAVPPLPVAAPVSATARAVEADPLPAATAADQAFTQVESIRTAPAPAVVPPMTASTTPPAPTSIPGCESSSPRSARKRWWSFLLGGRAATTLPQLPIVGRSSDSDAQMPTATGIPADHVIHSTTTPASPPALRGGGDRAVPQSRLGDPAGEVGGRSSAQRAVVVDPSAPITTSVSTPPQRETGEADVRPRLRTSQGGTVIMRSPASRSVPLSPTWVVPPAASRSVPPSASAPAVPASDPAAQAAAERVRPDAHDAGRSATDHGDEVPVTHPAPVIGDRRRQLPASGPGRSPSALASSPAARRSPALTTRGGARGRTDTRGRRWWNAWWSRLRAAWRGQPAGTYAIASPAVGMTSTPVFTGVHAHTGAPAHTGTRAYPGAQAHTGMAADLVAETPAAGSAVWPELPPEEPPAPTGMTGRSHPPLLPERAWSV